MSGDGRELTGPEEDGGTMGREAGWGRSVEETSGLTDGGKGKKERRGCAEREDQIVGMDGNTGVARVFS